MESKFCFFSVRLFEKILEICNLVLFCFHTHAGWIGVGHSLCQTEILKKKKKVWGGAKYPGLCQPRPFVVAALPLGGFVSVLSPLPAGRKE